MGLFLSHHSREDWSNTCDKCRSILLACKKDERKLIPNEYSDDPIYEFEELRPLEGSVFRFIVFCLWLEKQLLSYYQCQRIIAAHPYAWKISVHHVNWCTP